MRAESTVNTATSLQTVLASGTRLPMFVSGLAAPRVLLDKSKGTVQARRAADIAEDPEQAMTMAIQARIQQTSQHRARRQSRRMQHQYGSSYGQAQPADVSAQLGDHPTIMASIVSLPVRNRASGGMYMYEVRVLEPGAAVVGWASASFFGFAAGHVGVGDDNESIGFSLRRKAILHNGEIVRPVPSGDIGVGDVIRCAFDTRSGNMYLQIVPAPAPDAYGRPTPLSSLSEAERLVMAEDAEWIWCRQSVPSSCVGMRPAVTLRGVSFRFEARFGGPSDPLYFGHKGPPDASCPPDKSFAIHSWLEQCAQQQSDEQEAEAAAAATAAVLAGLADDDDDQV